MIPARVLIFIRIFLLKDNVSQLYDFFSKRKTPCDEGKGAATASDNISDTQELPELQMVSSTSTLGSSSATVIPPIQKSSKGKKPHKFQTKWLHLWTWLSYENGEMYCTTCKDARRKEIFGKDAYFVTRGNVDFRTSRDEVPPWFWKSLSKKIHGRDEVPLWFWKSLPKFFLEREFPPSFNSLVLTLKGTLLK